MTQCAIHNVTFDQETSVLRINNTDNFSLNLKFQEIAENATFFSQPRVITDDGMEIKVNKDGDPVSFFIVNNTISFGFSFIRNFFLGMESETVINGGGSVDTFFNSVNRTSYVFGNSEENLIFLNTTETSLQVRLVSMDYLLTNDPDFAEYNGANIIYKNVTVIVGRDNYSDIAIVDCNIRSVDVGLGGDNDEIIFPYISTCNYTQVMVAIRGHPTVTSRAYAGTFYYRILDDEPQDFAIQCENCVWADHYVVLPHNISNIMHIKANHTRECSVSVLTDAGKTLTYTLNNSDPCVLPNILTADVFEITTSAWTGLLYSNYMNTENRTVTELREEFYPLAKRLNMSLNVFSTEMDDMLSLPRNSSEFVWSNPTKPCHLFGGPTNTLFVINKGHNDTKSIVSIYAEPDTVNTIDLTQLVRPVRNHRMTTSRAERVPLYLPELNVVGTDMFMYVESSPESHPADISFIDFRDYVQNLTIMAHEVLMEIKQDEIGSWILFPLPIIINTTLQMIDEESLEDSQEFQVHHQCADGPVAMAYGDSLVVTNAFGNHTSVDSEDFFVMVFDSYLGKRSGRSVQLGKPSGVHLSFQNKKRSGYIDDFNLDHINLVGIQDVYEVLAKERENVEGAVFGFKCKEEGTFKHPRKCDVYYKCTLISQTEFLQYEFTCPSGTVFCKERSRCERAATCPCPS
ncbi:hypothetical protein Fcan01_22791 [Folsomia candida]|uniref:Chitin-binding type-2 domain-containing protein n=1 Tax=Folsomia candida TaxID=158441 RepID=A0A226DB18_FOLCA|nr:hypothetical protein Fcan01_22791 [Folsomia candida]